MAEEESKWSNIVYNPDAANSKIAPTTEEEIEPSNDNDPPNKWAGIQFNTELESNITYDKTVDLDINEYRDELGSDIFMPDGDNGIDILDANRANNQGIFTQAGNFLAQTVVGEVIGGTIEGLGYMLDVGSIVDVLQGDEAEWGNFMSDFGQSIREGTEENFRIHTDPTATGFGKMADSGWWFSNGVSVASTLSMLIPTTGALKALSFVGKGLAATKGMQAARKAAGLAGKMGTKGKWMTEGLSQAVLSRNIENWMEAHGTYEDHKQEKLSQVDPETGELYTEDRANEIASGAAADNYKQGWAMLLQDIPQYLALGRVFNPISKKMEKVKSLAGKKGFISKMKPWQQKGLAIGGTFASEGTEEAIQFLISERAKLHADLKAGYIDQGQYDRKMSDAYGSEEMLTSAFFGGLGGNLFQAAGSGVNKAFKSKTRKEYEASIGAAYSDTLNNDAKEVSLMFQHLNKADQEGSVMARESIINSMMLNLTSKALENDKFDQFYETMSQISGMSEEDMAAFEETTGTAFNADLAKQYTPQILKTSLEMRDKYLSHRNTYGALTSSRLSRLEIENNALNGLSQKKAKDILDIHSNMGEAWNLGASQKLKTKLAVKAKGTILRRRKKGLAAELKAETSDVKKAFIQKAIDINELKLKQQAKETKAATKARKESTEKIDDVDQAADAAAESAYQSMEGQLIGAMEVQAMAEERRIINNQDISYSKTEDAQNKIKSEAVRRRVEDYEAVDDLKKTLDAVDAMEFMEDSEKSSIKDVINKKIDKIKEAEKDAEAIRRAEEVEKNKREKNDAINEDPTTVNNQVRKDIGDVVEDENFDEEPNVTYEQLESSTKIEKTKAGSGDLMALLDQVSGTEAYQAWNENPVSKVGREFGYTVSERNEALTDLQNNAIEAFEKLKPGDKIPQSVYDNLPIQATLKDHSSIYTYLATKPTEKSSEERKREYQDGYAAQRVIIINKLKKGLTVTSTVALNTGGDLKTDYDSEEKTVPEHSIMDLKQIDNNLNNVNLLVTDKDGFLMTPNKENDKELGNRAILLDRDKKGNRMPYRGGMFLKVRKANGEPFALRLNLLKNTREQAEVLAELLIKIGVPVAQRGEDGSILKNKKGTQIVKKEVVLGATISELDEGLRASIEEIMGPELAMLDSKYKNPKIIDLINSFIYVSSETQNKTSELYFSPDNNLMFGGKSVTLINRADTSVHEELITFLMEKKRRQFNLKMWEDNPAYKEYVVDNKIINTDATTGGPMFVNTRGRQRTGEMTGRRIQLYMNPVTSEGQSGVVKDAKGNESLSNQSTQSELSHEKGFSFNASAFGGPAKSSSTSPTVVEEKEQYQGSQVGEIYISTPKLIDILNLKEPTQTGINRILSLELTDESAVELLAEKGIISEMQGAKGRKFLMSKEDSLKSFNDAVDTVIKISDTEVRKEDLKEVSSAPKDAAKEVVSQTFINFSSEENIDEDEFGDIEMGNEPVKEIQELNEGKPEKTCKSK